MKSFCTWKHFINGINGFYLCFCMCLRFQWTTSHLFLFEKKRTVSLTSIGPSPTPQFKSILRRSAFFTAQPSHPYMTTEKTIALTRFNLKKEWIWVRSSEVDEYTWHILQCRILQIIPWPINVVLLLWHFTGNYNTIPIIPSWEKLIQIQWNLPLANTLFPQFNKGSGHYV